MSSDALAHWRTVGLARIAELEAVHVNLTGAGPGRRWGTNQVNRSLYVALVAQFQGFCRDLHDEALRVYLDEANPLQRQNLATQLRQGRRLDLRNPRRSTLGHDFGRLGLDLIGGLKQVEPECEMRLVALDQVVDYRNAVTHGDEVMIEQIETSGAVRSTKRSFQRHRRIFDRLAGTVDHVVAGQLARFMEIDVPW